VVLFRQYEAAITPCSHRSTVTAPHVTVRATSQYR